MKVENYRKESFFVIGKEGSTEDGADFVRNLWAEANAHFSEMKKSVKKIIKNRKDTLFEDFLSGRTRKADAWKISYLENPLLRMVATILVWKQNNKTFTLKVNVYANATVVTAGE